MLRHSIKRSVLCVLILVLVLGLAACSNAPADNTTAPQTEPPVASKLYWNLEQGKTHTAGSDGTCTMNFVCEGKQVSLKVSGAELIKAIEKMSLIGLEFNAEGVVTDYVPLMDLPYQRVTWEYFVFGISGKTVQTNATDAKNGKDVSLELQDNTLITVVVDGKCVPITLAELTEGDRVTAVADASGKVSYVFVTRRSEKAELKTKLMNCAHCKKEVEFVLWDKDNVLPNQDGHYCLTKDISMKKATTITALNGMCLDLTGKTIKQTVDGVRLYSMAKSVVNLMDSVGTGVIIPATTSTDGTHPSKWGMIFEINHSDAVLRIYGGTLDASGKKAQYGNTINLVSGHLEMYGGTIKGGQAYGTGSSALRVNGTFDFYDGTIIGGTNFDEGYQSINVHGGATLRVGADSLMNMYGGTITGGESDFDGGVMRVLGVLNMKGGSISGGKCKGVGGGIYVMEGGSVIVSGDAKIFDNEGTNLYLSKGTNLTIKELTTGENGAKIGISMENPGLVSVSKVSAETAGCIVSDDPALNLTQNAEGQLVLG